MGLGSAVYIPVQISQREGGRKSLYYLNAGEEVLAGIFVTGQGIALKFIKRDTGSSLPAQTGDMYSIRVTNLAGEVIVQEQGGLEVVNPATGSGQITTAIAGIQEWFFGSGITITYPQASSFTVDLYYTAITHQDYDTAYKYLDASKVTLGGQPLTQSLFLQTGQALDAQKGPVRSYSFSTSPGNPLGPKTFIVTVTRNGPPYTVHLQLNLEVQNGNIGWMIVSIDNI
jgi:hypothetical protein